MRNSTLKVLVLALAVAAGQRIGRAKVVEDSTGSLQTLSSIADALDSPDRHPVHVLYVHGIDQIGSGDSEMLRDSICTVLKLCAKSDWKYGARSSLTRESSRRASSPQHWLTLAVRFGVAPRSGTRQPPSSSIGSRTFGGITQCL